MGSTRDARSLAQVHLGSTRVVVEVRGCAGSARLAACRARRGSKGRVPGRTEREEREARGRLVSRGCSRVTFSTLLQEVPLCCFAGFSAPPKRPLALSELSIRATVRVGALSLSLWLQAVQGGGHLGNEPFSSLLSPSDSFLSLSLSLSTSLADPSRLEPSVPSRRFSYLHLTRWPRRRRVLPHPCSHVVSPHFAFIGSLLEFTSLILLFTKAYTAGGCPLFNTIDIPKPQTPTCAGGCSPSSSTSTAPPPSDASLKLRPISPQRAPTPARLPPLNLEFAAPRPRSPTTASAREWNGYLEFGLQPSEVDLAPLYVPFPQGTSPPQVQASTSKRTASLSSGGGLWDIEELVPSAKKPRTASVPELPLPEPHRATNVLEVAAPSGLVLPFDQARDSPSSSEDGFANEVVTVSLSFFRV